MRVLYLRCRRDRLLRHRVRLRAVVAPRTVDEGATQMTIVDEAIQAATATRRPTATKWGNWEDCVLSALRAALPLDPSAETLEEYSRKLEPGSWSWIDEGDSGRPLRAKNQSKERIKLLERALSAYRDHPLWVALWGDKP